MSRFRSLYPRAWVIAVCSTTLIISAFAIVAFAKNDDAKPAKKKLTGEQLYAINCNRCHAERYATERTDAQWQTVMLHMRTRAQIPAADAKAILKYLQDNN